MLNQRLLSFFVNGNRETLTVAPNRTLLNVLREDLGLTGAKPGCEAGECGACTVIIDGKPINSCMVLAVEMEGAVITTIEGLGGLGGVDEMQQAFVDQFALQCGYCTPGMILMGNALLAEKQDPTAEEVKEYISGNLCRCTGYENIVKAILAVAASRKAGAGA